MRSISGFNGSSINGSFAAGDPISASKLNQLATGIDITRTMMSNDIQFMGNTGGTAYSLGQQVYYGTIGEVCPLQIYNLRYDETADKYYINVSPGMVNNYGVVDQDDNPLSNNPAPNIQVFADGLNASLTTNYVYIKVPNSGDPDFHYPDPENLPYIKVESTLKDDTDLVSYFLIGIVTGLTDAVADVDVLNTYNYKGCGSLWSTRFQCGTGHTAQYWWSAV